MNQLVPLPISITCGNLLEASTTSESPPLVEGGHNQCQCHLCQAEIQTRKTEKKIDNKWEMQKSDPIFHIPAYNPIFHQLSIPAACVPFFMSLFCTWVGTRDFTNHLALMAASNGSMSFCCQLHSVVISYVLTSNIQVSLRGSHWVTSSGIVLLTAFLLWAFICHVDSISQLVFIGQSHKLISATWRRSELWKSSSVTIQSSL